MNYHKLKKRAISGPVNPYTGSGFSGLKNHQGVCIAIMQDGKPEFLDGKPTARLIAHCTNNFDKALDWLKNELRFRSHSDECASRRPASYEGNPSDKGCNCLRRPLRKLIAELEDVK